MGKHIKNKTSKWSYIALPNMIAPTATSVAANSNKASRPGFISPIPLNSAMSSTRTGLLYHPLQAQQENEKYRLGQLPQRWTYTTA